MDVLTRLIVCAIAVYRLAELVVIDDGPFEIFINLRGWLNQASFESKSLRRTLANALTCPHCVGVWFAFVFALSFYFSNIVVDFTILFLAVAGLQSILAGKLGRTSQ
jgi:hypothetical protein